MRNIYLTLACVTLLSTGAGAQTLSGAARVVDGDTLTVDGAKVRLFGIDAPESSQTCTRDKQAWACGEEAAHQLHALVDGNQVECQSTGRDTYGRLIAVCSADGLELNQTMVAQGWAVAFRQYSDAYLADETNAKSQRRGIWSSSFTMPQDYRRAQRGTAAPQGLAALPAQRVSPNSGQPPGCLIKGNRNRRGEWIYHLPGMPYYEQTRAEEMFCTEAQAQTAGYRRAKVQ